MGTRDRYGEQVDEDQADELCDDELCGDESDEQPVGEHDPRCAGGWLPETADGRAVPCLVCRPHLGPLRRRLRFRVEADPR